MMSVNPGPNQWYQAAAGSSPTGCGAALQRTSPKGTCIRQQEQQQDVLFAKCESDMDSPGSTTTSPGDFSEFGSSSDSDVPSTCEARKTSGSGSPVTTETEPGVCDSTLSDLDGIDVALVQQLLAGTVQRAKRVLQKGGDRIDASLAKALLQYIETASAMQEGVAKKDHVLAMIEYVEPLLTSATADIISTSTSEPSVHSDSSGSSSSPSTPEIKQHSPRLIDLVGDLEPAVQLDKRPARSGKQFRAAPGEPDGLDWLGFPAKVGSSGTGSEVFLHVYDVGVLAPSVHKVLASLGTGAYHVGVEVYGREFCYGNTHVTGDVTGVSMQHTPCEHLFHKYCGSVSLGRTAYSPSQVKDLIEELKIQWLARDYHTLRNNCVSFAEVLCTRLGVDAPPEEVGALAKGLKGFLWN